YSMFLFFQAEDGIRDPLVTGVQTCALPIWEGHGHGMGARWRRAAALSGHEPGRGEEHLLLRYRHGRAARHLGASAAAVGHRKLRSEERRVGKEWRSRWVRQGSHKNVEDDEC